MEDPDSSAADPLLRGIGFDSRQAFRITFAGIVICALIIGTAWSFLPPPLPSVVRLGTGPADGHYARFGESLRDQVAEHGIELELVFTAGSPENIRMLLRDEIDVGLIQSGNLSAGEGSQLASVATVFYEPVLIVERAAWASVHGHDIDGGRIAIGLPGGGANVLARELLADQGIREGEPPGTHFVEIGDQRAVEALQAGDVDSAIFVTTLEVPWVRTVFTDASLQVTHLALAEAFTRHYRYLQQISIPLGLIDLRDEIPANEVDLIATTATLAIRPGAHQALIPLLIESARGQLFQGNLLAEPGEFPSPHGVEAPLAEAARGYFEHGPSFFYRWLPFRYAFGATRLLFLLLPLVTLLYPLYRSGGPAYRWLNERRVYRWYRILRKVEEQMDANSGAASLAKTRKDLERFGEKIRTTHVPARYGAKLFALRAHHRLLVDRLNALEESAASS